MTHHNSSDILCKYFLLDSYYMIVTSKKCKDFVVDISCTYCKMSKVYNRVSASAKFVDSGKIFYENVFLVKNSKDLLDVDELLKELLRTLKRHYTFEDRDEIQFKLMRPGNSKATKVFKVQVL